MTSQQHWDPSGQDHHAFVISMQRELKHYHIFLCISWPFLKVYKCNLKFLVEFLKKIILSAQELNFRRYG